MGSRTRRSWALALGLGLIGLAGTARAASKPAPGPKLRVTLLAPAADREGKLGTELDGLLDLARGSDLAVLPAFATYRPGIEGARLLAPGVKGEAAAAAKAVRARALAWPELARRAKARGLAVLAGCLDRDGDRLRSRALALDPGSGMTRGTDQTHFRPGGLPFEPGRVLSPLGHPFPGIGVLVGDDLDVPEAGATLVAQGVELLVALSPPVSRHPGAASLARVLGCFVAVVDWREGAALALFNPLGAPVRPLESGPGHATYELPRGRALALRATRPPRRPELYRDLAAPVPAGAPDPKPSPGPAAAEPGAGAPAEDFELEGDLMETAPDGPRGVAPAVPSPPKPASSITPQKPGMGRPKSLESDEGLDDILEPESGAGTTGNEKQSR